MLRRFHLASSSSTASSSRVIGALQHSPSLLQSANSKSHYIRYANCTTYEAFAARQHGYASRLAVAAPLVAAEWDYSKNPTRYFPSIVGCSTLEPFWWRCPECDHSYRMSPEQRTIRGVGCPQCASSSSSFSLSSEAVSTENENEKRKQKESEKSKAVSTISRTSSKNKEGKSIVKKQKRSTKSVSVTKPKSRKDDDVNDEDALPGEVNPRLKALASGKAMMIL